MDKQHIQYNSTCLLHRGLLATLKGHTVIEGVLRHEWRKMKTPKINIAPPSGLRLNGVCENRKRNSGVKQIE